MAGQRRSLTILAALVTTAMLQSCATTHKVDVIPLLETATPSEIIAGGKATGRFELSGRCIVFAHDGWRHAAVFPTGSTLASDGSFVKLPDNGAIAKIGSKATISYEAPPSLRSMTFSCEGDPILILSVSR